MTRQHTLYILGMKMHVYESTILNKKFFRTNIPSWRTICDTFVCFPFRLFSFSHNHLNLRAVEAHIALGQLNFLLNWIELNREGLSLRCAHAIEAGVRVSIRDGRGEKDPVLIFSFRGVDM